MSIASMILGIVGIVAWIIPVFGFLIILAGLVLGLFGKKKGGKGFAITWIVLCSITISLAVATSVIGAYSGYMELTKLSNSVPPKNH